MSSTILPLAIATTRSQDTKTWCRLWLMRMPVTFCAARPLHEAEHLGGLLDREMIGGFVEDEHFRFEVHRAGDGDALALAAGELSDQSVRRAQMQVDIGDRADRIPRAFFVDS